MLKETDYFGNNIRITKFKVQENLRKLYMPVNKTHWDMTPSTVNAYYSPTRYLFIYLFIFY